LSHAHHFSFVTEEILQIEFASEANEKIADIFNIKIGVNMCMTDSSSSILLLVISLSLVPCRVKQELTSGRHSFECQYNMVHVVIGAIEDTLIA